MKTIQLDKKKTAFLEWLIQTAASDPNVSDERLKELHANAKDFGCKLAVENLEQIMTIEEIDFRTDPIMETFSRLGSQYPAFQ